MSFWSGEKLKERLGDLITPFDPAQVDCAGYRLRVGPEIYVSPTGEAKNAKTQTKVLLGDKASFTVPPGQFAFLLTEERVKVPPDALAFISIRATIKFRGLVNVSGFHVDPGYDGRLVFSVFNAGPAPVHLARGDDCFLIWYADLDRTSAEIKIGGGFDSIPSALINPIAGEVQSFEGLLAKIEKVDDQLTGKVHAVEREQTVIKWAATAIAVALLTLLVREFVPQRQTALAPAAVTPAPVVSAADPLSTVNRALPASRKAAESPTEPAPTASRPVQPDAQ